MFDLGLGSLESHSLSDLVSLLVSLGVWIAAVVLIGVDVLIVAYVLWNVVPILAELGRRAWVWARTRMSPKE